MNPGILFFLGLGLAMDAVAVSIMSGVIIQKLKARHALMIACFFGGFQALMPVIGWLAGLSVLKYVAAFDHWLAFAILTVIGSKMIYEGTKIRSEKNIFDPLNAVVLLMLALATSLDALAVGFTLPLLNVSFILPPLIIGTTTFVLCFFGVYAGDRFGHFLENYIEYAGGAMLICIGIKILADHIIP